MAGAVFRGVSGVSGNPFWVGLYILEDFSLSYIFSQLLYFDTNFPYPEVVLE